MIRFVIKRHMDNGRSVGTSTFETLDADVQELEAALLNGGYDSAGSYDLRELVGVEILPKAVQQAQPGPVNAMLVEALEHYANHSNWAMAENGVDRIWVEPNSSTPEAYHGWQLANAALAAAKQAQPNYRAMVAEMDMNDRVLCSIDDEQAQPEPVNALLVEALQAAENLEHEALVALSEATYELKVGNTYTTATDTYKANNDLIHRLDKILNSQYRDRKRAALTAAQQAQPVCGYDDETGNCTRVNCCKQAQPERAPLSDRLDAERYRWLRPRFKTEWNTKYFSHRHGQERVSSYADVRVSLQPAFAGIGQNPAYAVDGLTIDKSIDAAIKQGGQHG